ncbi:MAG: hypothetical protein COB01_11775 [Lutibacter sp.]|nr:MAG: hypothetical protein COB01_11775 [Lutibacter sp.]
MDEWHFFGKLIKEEQESRIITLRKITKPVIDRINKWEDMRKYRNNIIAHNHRIKKEDNSLAIFNLSRNLNCPNSFFDYKLLLGCIYITKNVLLKIFPKEYNQILPSLKSIKGITPINEIKDEKSFRNEFDHLTKDVERLIETLI